MTDTTQVPADIDLPLMDRPDPFLGVKTPLGTKRVRMLGVYYLHRRAEGGGDLFVTKLGLPFFENLKVRNWHESDWFKSHREKLRGTSTIYKIPSKEVNGRVVNFVVKWCRVGEDVPLDTIGFNRFEHAEFNTPFEEFALVTEMRERRTGPKIRTIRPLAIYVPPETLKPWQSTRSKSRVARKNAKYRDVELDVLRQYIMVYEWLDGESADAALEVAIPDREQRLTVLKELTERARADMEENGFFVVDHKPDHVILRTRPDGTILRKHDGRYPYALVDFELLNRTPEYERQVEAEKRKRYLNHQKLRFNLPRTSPLPPHLKHMNIFGVDYIWGHAESTHGLLWVVGRDPALFDYFLPERWRHTNRVKLSKTAESYHTISKDHVKLVWKVSRVGERPDLDPNVMIEGDMHPRYNSPFEEVAIAIELYKRGFSVVYPRAIYMAGIESSRSSGYVEDMSRFDSHRAITTPEGQKVLNADHNYITIWGYWQGRISDQGNEDLPPCTGVDLVQARREGLIDETIFMSLVATEKARLEKAGFTTTVKPTHFLLSRASDGSVIRDSEGKLLVTISNFELINRIAPPDVQSSVLNGQSNPVGL